MSKNEVFLQISSRHIGQLGRELVTDYTTALTELVKNAYDADAEAVQIDFSNLKADNSTILIADTGRGFTIDDIVHKWAVIGTNSKIQEPYSPKYKRRCSGRKGIGRFSVERLGEYFTLYSIADNGNALKYTINWNNFEGIDSISIKHAVAILRKKADIESAKKIKIQIEYILNNTEVEELDKNIINTKILNNGILNYNCFFNQIKLDLIETYLFPILEKYQGEFRSADKIPTTVETLEGQELNEVKKYLTKIYNKSLIEKPQISGTIIKLQGLRDVWAEDDIKKVFKELRTLVSPIKRRDDFSIFINCSDYNIEDLKLTNDILDLKFAYLRAEINNDANKLHIYFEVQGKEIPVSDKILFEDDSAICGDFSLELYYFLRDESLKKGALNMRQAQNLLNEFCGVKIYRDGFRVRPYGESGNDWLLLDNKKIKDTHGYLIGNNQVIGIINISSDNNPLLVDSTNREAIIENEAFSQMKKIVLDCLDVIKEYRYKIYEEERKKDKIPQIDEARARTRAKLLSDVDSYSKKIYEATKKNSTQIIPTLVSSMLDIIATERQKNDKYYEDIKKQYNKQLKDLKDDIQLYRNLASLGILAGSFGHETDDALSRIRTNIAIINKKLKLLKIEDTILNDSIDDLRDDNDRILNYSYLLLNFIKRKKRKYEHNLSIITVLNGIVEKYKEIIKSYNIEIETSNVTHNFGEKGIRQIDLESILINLLTNAFEALKKVSHKRIIRFSTRYNYSNDTLFIIVEDSGRGVPKDKREWIFMPLKTTKDEDGVGLGLTIVKDIVEDNFGKIYVDDSDLGGAKFIVEFQQEVSNEQV